VGYRSPGRTGHSSAPAAEWLAVAVAGWWSWPASAAESWSWPAQWSSVAGWLWSEPGSPVMSRSRSPSRCGPVALPGLRWPQTRRAGTRRRPAPSPGATMAACLLAVALVVVPPSRPAVPGPSRRWAGSVRSAGPSPPPRFMLPERALLLKTTIPAKARYAGILRAARRAHLTMRFGSPRRIDSPAYGSGRGRTCNRAIMNRFTAVYGVVTCVVLAAHVHCVV
jgi:hypothetical protein